MLSFYNCYKKPTRENLRTIILELAHQEIIQKPKYIANCFKEILLSDRCDQMLESAEWLRERTVFSYLTRFIKSLSMDDLKLFLWLLTTSDLAPTPITVEFGEQLFGAPAVRKCSNTITLSPTYACYNQLGEEITNILRNKDSFSFHLV